MCSLSTKIRNCTFQSTHTFKYSSTYFWQQFISADLQLLGLEKCYRFQQSLLKKNLLYGELIKKTYPGLESDFKNFYPHGVGVENFEVRLRSRIQICDAEPPVEITILV